MYGRDVYLPLGGGYVALVAAVGFVAIGEVWALGVAVLVALPGVPMFALARQRIRATNRRYRAAR